MSQEGEVGDSVQTEVAPGASVETHIALIHQKLDQLISQRDDHESRLRAVEPAVTHLDQLRSENVELRKDNASLEARVRILEQWRWLVIGVAAAAGSAASWAFKFWG